PAGVVLMVGNIERFDPAYQSARPLVAGGAICAWCASRRWRRHCCPTCVRARRRGVSRRGADTPPRRRRLLPRPVSALPRRARHPPYAGRCRFLGSSKIGEVFDCTDVMLYAIVCYLAAGGPPHSWEAIDKPDQPLQEQDA